jgi:predicted ATP-grasp superfamily ATP-dependent carboligase
VREKGKTIEDGGFVMTADSWFGPQIAALKELHEFDARYWKQLQGTDAMGMSAEQMATVAALYPMVKQASERLSKESAKLQGTPLATTTTFDVVKSKEQMAQQTESSNSGGGGGFSGMLARKLAKKDGEAKPRATVFTVFSETQEISTTVAAADVAVPADFKEKK